MVSVLTATIPERADMLAENKRSVAAQTFRNLEHVVIEDTEREGCSATYNKLAERAKGEGLFILADDDLLLPGCIQAHIDASADADIVYAPPLVWGLHDPWWFYQAPPAIPAVALMRRELWHDLGGYDETAVREEDRKLWIRAMETGATFKRISTNPTWVYRIHGNNKSFQ